MVGESPAFARILSVEVQICVGNFNGETRQLSRRLSCAPLERLRMEMRTHGRNAHQGNGISGTWSHLRRKLAGHFQTSTPWRTKRLTLEKLESRLAMTGVVINEFLA